MKCVEEYRRIMEMSRGFTEKKPVFTGVSNGRFEIKGGNKMFSEDSSPTPKTVKVSVYSDYI